MFLVDKFCSNLNSILQISFYEVFLSVHFVAGKSMW